MSSDTDCADANAQAWLALQVFRSCELAKGNAGSYNDRANAVELARRVGYRAFVAGFTMPICLADEPVLVNAFIDGNSIARSEHERLCTEPLYPDLAARRADAADTLY